jgi:hypothetical protein
MSSRNADSRLQLIVNADDFGQSEDTVAATVECFEAGGLTSASVMAGAQATEQAVEYALAHPEFGYGVHLTFVRHPLDRPVSDPELVPSLVDGEGCLLTTRAIRAKALTGRLAVPDLEREIEAQVEAISATGVPVSHVDSHRHVHKLAPFRQALSNVLPRLGVRHVRNAQDVFLTRQLLRPTYWVGRRWRRRIQQRFATTDHFFMPLPDEPPWAEGLLAILDGLPGRSLEVGVHPGYAEPWRDRDRLDVLRLLSATNERVQLVDWRSL